MNTIPTNKPNVFLHWWQSPKLPPVHIWVSPQSRPSNPYLLARLYFRKWLVHPIKRRLAKYYLKYLQVFKGTTVVGITGSAGKTTTKEMLASILKQKGETVYSFANIDPVYNIPTTILKCTNNTKYLILEFGVEYPGEMEFYLWLAKPKVGILTNVYQTHTLFFGDAEGVAKEKGVLVKSLDKDDTAVLNYDNPHTLKLGGRLKAKVVWFGTDAFVKASNDKITDKLTNSFTLHIGEEKIQVNLPIPGKQFMANALATAGAASTLGFTLQEIKNGLENFQQADHRMKPIKYKSGALILDDSYNANPSAMKEALDTLQEVAGKRNMVAVLGDMLELGSTETQRHKELGKLAAKIGVKELIGVGPRSKNTVESFILASKRPAKWFATPEEAETATRKTLDKRNVVLIKGSRSIGLDRLVNKLS